MTLKIAAVLFLSAVCPLWGSAVPLELKILFCCRLVHQDQKETFFLAFDCLFMLIPFLLLLCNHANGLPPSQKNPPP